MQLTRRHFLRAAALGASAASLPSCCWTRRVRVACPTWAIEPGKPLAVDVHAHFFNASDLAIKGFVQRILSGAQSAALASIADLLEQLTWAAAPSGEEERRMLVRLSGALGSCPEGEVPTLVNEAREARYAQAVQEIQEVARTKVTVRSERSALAAQAAGQLPATYREFREAVDEAGHERATRVKTVRSALLLVVELLQYRTTGFFDYLESLQKAGGPRLDLSLSALVDYDWWIEGGQGTRTPLPVQVELARDLAVFAGGRVHAWAPFCPLRELMHRASPSAAFSSLDLVRKAVLEQGAVGVKLYPPMGFAVAGNAGRDVWREASWLPPAARQAGFGASLDGVLDELFGWCERQGVPVLAHSSPSNGPTRAFEQLALADGWALALKAHPGLRVLFGHLGGASNSGGVDHAKAFRELMAPSGAGASAYADASYWEDVLEDVPGLQARLDPLYAAPVGLRPVLLDRLCFGTDWKMLAVERRAGQYAARMDQLIRAIAKQVGGDSPDAVANAFFGANAVAVLGLRRGEATRRRLDEFYATNGVPRPAWAVKVDGGRA